MKMKDLVTAAGVVAIGYVIYKSVKKDMEKTKIFEEDKNELLNNTPSLDEIDNAIVNDDLWQNDKAAGIVEVLRNQYHKIKHSTNYEELNDHHKGFMEMWGNLTNDDLSNDQRLAWSIVYQDRLKSEKELKERTKQEIKEKKVLTTELEKARIIARSIDNLEKIARGTKRGGLEDLVNAANTISVTIGKNK